MWEAPHLRCSDADRDRAAAVLRDSLGEGRIAVGELDDRLERVYSARTYGELTAVMSDLPAWSGAAAPPAASPWPQAAAAVAAERARRSVRRQVRRFAIVMAVCWLLVVSTASGHGGAVLWPLWLMVPWGIAILARLGRRDRVRRRDRQEGPGA